MPKKKSPRPGRKKANTPSAVPRPRTVRAVAGVAAAPVAAADNKTVLAWENDPFASALSTGDAVTGTPFVRPVPDLNAAALPVRIGGVQPAAGQYPVGSPEFRFWAAADALRRGADYWAAIVPEGTAWHPTVGSRLTVQLDAGDQLNAYYTRTGLEFYHASVQGRAVFGGESPDTLLHEFGHAVLDAIRPELWPSALAETAAFHESFGDISAMLCSLQLPSLRERLLVETQGQLYRTSRLSRLHEMLGWAIRQRNPAGAEPDCLRNAVNAFFYHDPATLPPTGPASMLTSAAHNFSRVFTGAFLETVAGMVTAQPTVDSDAILRVSQAAGRLLVRGILTAPVTAAYFSSVAGAIVQAAAVGDREIASGAFIRHGILSLESAHALQSEGGPAAGDPSVGMAGGAPAPRSSRRAAVPAASLPGQGVTLTAIACPEYGFGADSVQVHLPNDPTPGMRPAAAALDTGSLTAASTAAAAKSYLEDLFRRGRIAMPDTGHAFSQRLAKKTHVLRRTGNRLELTRLCFDCGFDLE